MAVSMRLKPSVVLTGLEAYSAGQEMLSVYSERLDSTFLHMLLSEMQLLDDGKAVHETASSDWETIASRKSSAVGDSIADMVISAEDGLYAIRDYVLAIAQRTESGELMRFVSVISTRDDGWNSNGTASDAWQAWSNCVERVRSNPRSVYL